MPILGYPAHPEHDQVGPAAVVFGVSDPDDRVRIPRRLLVDIVAVVADVLAVDIDQDELVEHLAKKFADRVLFVDIDQDRAEHERDDLAMWQACAAADEFAAAAESGVLL